MVFKHVIPILHSGDILRSIDYYVKVLGFDRSWYVGDPPEFGAVIKDSVEIFFSKNDQAVTGGWIYLVVDDIEMQHARVIEKGGRVVSPPATYEWNMREFLVEDPDSNLVRFAQKVSTADRQDSAAKPGDEISVRGFVPAQKIILDYPDTEGGYTEEMSIPFPAAVYAAVAENKSSGKVIGSVYLIGENGKFYYVRNLFVHPLWRNKGVATALMQELTVWLEKHSDTDISVWLHSAPDLGSFYKQFGFSEVFGMFRPINPKSS